MMITFMIYDTDYWWSFPINWGKGILKPLNKRKYSNNGINLHFLHRHVDLASKVWKMIHKYSINPFCDVSSLLNEIHSLRQYNITKSQPEIFSLVLISQIRFYPHHSFSERFSREKIHNLQPNNLYHLCSWYFCIYTSGTFSDLQTGFHLFDFVQILILICRFFLRNIHFSFGLAGRLVSMVYCYNICLLKLVWLWLVHIFLRIIWLILV